MNQRLIVTLCFLFAVIGIVAVFTVGSTPPPKPCISDHFGNPTDPLAAGSASTGAAGGPGVSNPTSAAGANTATNATAPSSTTTPIIPVSTAPPSGGPVPGAAQSSSISNTLPGSSVPDPSTSIAQNKDVQSTLDAMASFWTFIANTTPSLFPADVQQSVKETVGAINDITLPLNAAQLNPSSSSLTVSQLSALRDRILKTTARVSQLTASEGGASSASSAGSLSSGSSVGTAGSSVGTAGSSVGTAGSSVGTAGSSVGTATPGAPPPANPDVITLDTMKTVNTRVTATILALTNLSSSDTTIVQRISTLGLLKANLEDLITKVQTGAMDLKDVPIKPVDATAFLAALDDKTRPVLPLITPPGANQPPSSNVDSNSTAVLQSLVQSFQTILSTVKFQATYDPATAQNAAVMARLQALEDKLFAYANSATPLPPPILEVIKHELKVLGSIVKVDTSNQARCSPANSLPSISTRLDGDAGTSSTSIMDQLRAAGGASQEAGRGPFLNPVNGPGLTDAQRATRGSAAAFDERTVGGYNYRDRSIEICRQLKVEYGDNETFGCVADPNSVSANYSWKGNYLSVCNRLGDVWGSQGGDKYGCPPFDPSRKFRQS